MKRCILILQLRRFLGDQAEEVWLLDKDVARKTWAALIGKEAPYFRIDDADLLSNRG